MAGLKQFAPGLLELHQLEAEAPEEEIYLLAPGFASMVYEWVYILPSYAQWYAKADHTAGYQHFKKVLQTLQWLRGGKRWLLKAPQHMEQLKPLMSVFPDAVLVETLRDPLTAAASNANLSCYGQRLRTDHPNPLAAGASNEFIIGRLVEAYLHDRPADDDRFITIHFKDLMDDPIKAAEIVLTRAKIAATEASRAAMQHYVDANNAQPRKPVLYSPIDFGINVSKLREKFAPYYARFDVAPDPRF